MKLNKFAYLYSKPLGNHTLKIMKKYLEIYFKKPGKIMEFCQSEKVGTLRDMGSVIVILLALEEGSVNKFLSFT